VTKEAREVDAVLSSSPTFQGGRGKRRTNQGGIKKRSVRTSTRKRRDATFRMEWREKGKRKGGVTSKEKKKKNYRFLLYGRRRLFLKRWGGKKKREWKCKGGRQGERRTRFLLYYYGEGNDIFSYLLREKRCRGGGGTEKALSTTNKGGVPGALPKKRKDGKK